jgi:hypothetical protein
MSSCDRILAPVVLGTTAFYFAGILLGSVGLFRPLSIWIFLGAGLLLTVPCRSEFSRLARDILRLPAGWSTMDRILAFLIALLAGLQLLSGWIPPVFYDLLVYHFRAPAEFLRSGWLHFIPWNVFANSPMAFQLALGPARSPVFTPFDIRPFFPRCSCLFAHASLLSFREMRSEALLLLRCLRG